MSGALPLAKKIAPPLEIFPPLFALNDGGHRGETPFLFPCPDDPTGRLGQLPIHSRSRISRPRAGTGCSCPRRQARSALLYMEFAMALAPSATDNGAAPTTATRSRPINIRLANGERWNNPFTVLDL